MNEPLRIVFLVDSLIRGGVQSGLLLRASRLDGARFAPQVWVLRSGEKNWEMGSEFKAAGVTTRLVRVHDIADRQGILDLSSQLLGEEIDVLSTHNFLPNIVGRIAARVAARPALVANYHQTYETYWNRKFIACERTLRDTPRRFVCVSRAVMNYVTPLLHLPPDRVTLLYNGFDFELFAGAPARAHARQSIGLPVDRPLVGYVGRLAPIKDIPSFVRAMPAIAAQVPDVLFALAGDGEERAAIEYEVGAAGVADRVRFLGSRADIPLVMRALDCLVLPSRVEGFGRVVVEAQAAGTPVVATPVGAVPELIEDGVSGLLYPQGDSDALAAAVARTLLEPQATAQRVEKARRDAKRFDLDTWVRETGEIFEQVHGENIAQPGADHLKSPAERYREFRKSLAWRRFMSLLMPPPHRRPA